jgi:hypothetical protein
MRPARFSWSADSRKSAARDGIAGAPAGSHGIAGRAASEKHVTAKRFRMWRSTLTGHVLLARRAGDADRVVEVRRSSMRAGQRPWRRRSRYDDRRRCYRPRMAGMRGANLNLFASSQRTGTCCATPEPGEACGVRTSPGGDAGKGSGRACQSSANSGTGRRRSAARPSDAVTPIRDAVRVDMRTSYSGGVACFASWSYL